VVHRSCGNRHCPCCQQGKGHEWLERQRARQLPGEHFLLTFTVPAPLRPFLRRHQKIGYGALFEASAGAIKTLAVDPRHIGGDVPGFFGVLHTWGRTLQYHPHVGGALSHEDGRWHPARPGFYLPVRALSRIVRGKFRDRIDTHGLLGEIPAEVWAVEWNVNCQLRRSRKTPGVCSREVDHRAVALGRRGARVRSRSTRFSRDLP
jgi:hypothetical protein